MQINARIDVCVFVCVCVCVHSGPVWMKCPGLIFCPSPALVTHVASVHPSAQFGEYMTYPAYCHLPANVHILNFIKSSCSIT